MAEVKNAFIKSKMNKDLDARLIPQGEYRDAVNIQVSKSEGDDVGALENILGNSAVSDLNTLMEGGAGQECIGYLTSEFNSTVYLFFTDYTDDYNGGRQTYSATAKNYIIQYVSTTSSQGNAKKLVEGAFLNFSKNRPIIGVNLLENLLFFTDNRNQPRKINVDLAAANLNHYTKEDNISVAKYFPYQTIEVIKEISSGVYETTMKDVFSQYIPINDPAYTDNPYYNEDFPGDPKYLEDKFVRFSYRFKFEDGEYSLLAPFTQACFIPKQDGYFLQGDEQQTYASTIVEFMENKVNQIALQIPLPSAANSLNDDLKITELDIIYKESDALAIQVVDTVSIQEISNSAGSSSVFEYFYNSTKPFKTLPSSETPRVYDKVPVRALSQEIISNRIVYGNFQDKHTPPSGIKYQVAVSEKYNSTNPATSRSNVEYPNHNVKENRNYQVGIILADRYGRQSSVILSNEISDSTDEFGADTVYLPYSSTEQSYDSTSFLGNSLKVLFNQVISSTKSELTGQPGLYDDNASSPSYNPTGWYSYKIVVKQIEQEYYNVYTAGAMKDVPFDYSTTAPPNASNPLTPNTSFLTLINDNINKVPRDLSEVGPQDKSFRSSVVLFGRVENTTNEFSNIGNAQYVPTNERLSFTTNVIEDLFNLFDVEDQVQNKNKPITDDSNPFYPFYKSDSDPFIAEFITTQNTNDQFGVFNATTQGGLYLKIENLAILETKPTVSRLDIFYESSTSGLISEVNNAVGSSGGAIGTQNFNYSHFESFALNSDLTGDFVFLDILNQPLEPTSVTLQSVIDGDGTNRTNEFSFIDNGDFSYKLQNAEYFYYGTNAQITESYTFTFEVTVLDNGQSITTNVESLGNLQNTPPSIENPNDDVIVIDRGTSIIPLAQPPGGSGTDLVALNGSADPTQNTVFSSIQLTSQTGNGNFSLQGLSVINSDSLATGTGSFTIRVVDEGGSVAVKTFDVRFGEPFVDSSFNIAKTFIIDGDGTAVWFTDNLTNLTSNTNSTVFAGTTYLDGFQAPSSLNTTLTNYVCPGNKGTFNNQTTSSGLTQGTFYVYVLGSNTNAQPTSNTNVNIRHFIQYRASSSDPWTTAQDIRDVNIDTTSISGTWRYQNAFGSNAALEGYHLQSNAFQPSTGMNVNAVSGYSGNSSLIKSGKVYAFNDVGEYRVIIGNVQSDYGFFRFSPNCNDPQDFNASAELYVNDFYSPGTNNNFDGDGDGVYEYRIATSSDCDFSFTNTSTSYYATSPFAKYLTQLYTDINLTQTANISGTQRFRRLLTRGSSNISNPEFTKNGSYTGSFSNGALTSEPDPCLYTT